MRRILLAVALGLTLTSAARAQHYRSRSYKGPYRDPFASQSFGGYYNGYGYVPSYEFNSRSGWNTQRYANGGAFHWRNGYVPPHMNSRPGTGATLGWPGR